MKLVSDRIIQPLLSEKAAAREAKFNEFSLVVDKSMTKLEIAAAVEKLFGAKPLAVRTVNFRKKTRQTRFGVIPAKTYKKALIRMPEGKRIEIK